MILVEMKPNNVKDFVRFQKKSIQIKMDKLVPMNYVLISHNESSLRRNSIDFHLLPFELFSEQRQREVDEFVGILDPEQTGKVDFDAYIKDNFGDLDIEKLEATAATDPRSRETRRVRRKTTSSPLNIRHFV